MSTRELWQGRADSLCGVYCLLYPIRDLEIFGDEQLVRDRTALRALLKSAEDNDLLTAEYLAGMDGGYPAQELLTIFNGLPPRFRGGFHAVILKDHVPEYDGKVGKLKDFLDSGGYAVIDVQKTEHWVCARRIDDAGKALCFDPSAKRQVLLRNRASSDDGVALVPAAKKRR